MKYKGLKQKKENSSREWVIQVAAGISLAIVPFVISLVGLDTFRVPKDSFCVLFAALLIVLMVAFKGLSFQTRLAGWEWVLLAGVAYVGLHTLISSSPELSWSGFKSLVLFTLLFCVLKSILSTRIQQRVWLWIGAAVGVNGVLTVFQYYGMFDWMRSSTGRAIHGRINPAGFIGEVNSGGFLFGLAIIMLVYFVVVQHSLAQRVIAAVLIGFNLMGLAYSRTLTASLGLGACLLLWLVFHHWWTLRDGKGLRRELLVFWLVLVVVSFGALGIAYKAGITQRVGRVWKASEQGYWNYATAGRIPVFWLTWQMIQEDPWLGRGLNTFGKDFFYFRAETEAGQSVRLLHQSGVFREVHNEYLQIWEELGLPGLLVLLFLILSAMVISLSRLRNEENPQKAYWLGISTLGVVFVSISCIAFFPLHLSVTGVYTVVLFAGLRSSQDTSPVDSSGRGAILRPVGLGIVLAVTAGLALQAVEDWQANNEAGIAAFLLRSAQEYRPAQKRAIADEALNRLQKAESLAPGFYEVHNLKGSVLMMLGRYEQAVGSYSRGIELGPSPELYTNLAAAHLALGQKNRARECLNLALGYAPRYGKARQALRFLEDGK